MAELLGGGGLAGVVTRSAASTAREARRARGSRQLVGRRSEEGGCVTGHPALMEIARVFELERMPEGGGYPVGLVEVAARLMGCQDVGAVVHLCSGSVRAPLSFDIRAASSAACLADVRWLPIRPGSVRFIVVDPPYGADYAEALWGTGRQYPSPMVLLREAAEALAPGGRVALLHQVVPVLPPALTRVGVWGVSTGPGYRMRALTVAEKPEPPRGLW